MRHVVTSVLVVVGFVVAERAAAAQVATCPTPTSYTVVELVGLGGPVTEGLSINDLSVVGGWSEDAGWVGHAVRWSTPSTPTTLSSATSSGVGVSSDGREAGYVSTSGGRGAVWSASGSITLLNPLNRNTSSSASDVNAGGLAVGWSNGTGGTTATSWIGTAPTDLTAGMNPKPYNSLAFGVNNTNQIVGRGDLSVPPYARNAYLWSGGTATTLAQLGGNSSSASDISSNGRVAGSSADSTTRSHAVRWDPGNHIVDLGLYQGFNTAGYGVNNCGTVVGDALIDVGNEIYAAMVWQGGVARRLDDLIPPATWTLTTARGINTKGEIVGYGYRNGFSGVRAFKLIPVP
jgi:probable HAF family extracellular repeat protein